jgi:L-seryl-tRNA(Ser) seleniumtransferase
LELLRVTWEGFREPLALQLFDVPRWSEAVVTNPYRELPSIDRLLSDERVAGLTERFGHDAVLDLARAVLDEQRAAIESTGTAPSDGAVELLLSRGSALADSLVHVINATGVVIHTNLGRAPLSRSAMDAMQRVSAGYSTLEFDRESGGRGSRQEHLADILCRVTGAEAAMVVNNNAAALLLALAALCDDREVVIARGQLVEIGGGFRIPDVMRQSGAELVEVGTTNRTYIGDYEAALSEQTAALLRVHSSNFAVVGFTAEASIGSLAELAAARGVRLLDDVGSGALIDTRPHGLAYEPMVQESVAAGSDVVLFSGDKLLGGPQAGIAVGKRDAIEAMERHPLARAMRMDKASIAGLIATLGHYQVGDVAEAIPVWRMIAAPLDQLSRRARGWSRACGPYGEATAGRSTVGGGSLPGQGLPTMVCAVAAPDGDANALARKLRMATTPVITRISDGRVLLDPRTVDSREDGQVESALVSALGLAIPTGGAELDDESTGGIAGGGDGAGR